MPDVSQYRTELETLAAQYSSSIGPEGGGKPLEPHMLLAFLLLFTLDKVDEILTKIDDDD